MKVAVFTQYTSFLNNKLFTDSHCLDGAHGPNTHWLKPFQKLYATGQKYGVSFKTYDLLLPDQAQAFLMMDLHLNQKQVLEFKRINPNAKWILFNIETPLTHRYAFEEKNLSLFDSVVSYRKQGTLKHPKQIEIRIPVANPEMVTRNFENRKLLVMVNTFQELRLRKSLSIIKNVFKKRWFFSVSGMFHQLCNSGELYSERIRVARSLSAFEGFDLYGNGWSPLLFKAAKGACLESNRDIYSKYRFSICFENFKGSYGYVSEKIIDSLAAGCVPIYLGEKNISKFIPQSCYLDFREFNSISELKIFLKNCTESQWNELFQSGQAFLKSPEAEEFFSEAFARKFLTAFI